MGQARAAATACPPSDDACAALADRLDALTAAVAAIPAPSSGPAEVSGTVALSPGDSAKLDLAWGGIWLGLGMGAALVVGRMFNAEARKWSGGFR